MRWRRTAFLTRNSVKSRRFQKSRKCERTKLRIVLLGRRPSFIDEKSITEHDRVDRELREERDIS
jgi:hypothetical protein